MDFACLEMSILELWANDGKYDEATDKAMESLTNQDVLDKLNSFNKYEIIHFLLLYNLLKFVMCSPHGFTNSKSHILNFPKSFDQYFKKAN